jgi:hypothetical protein
MADKDKEDKKARARFMHVHDEAHDLAEDFLSIIDHFYIERGGVTIITVLLATEMITSVARKLGEDAGFNEEELQELQKMATKCGQGYYDLLSTKDKKSLENLAPTRDTPTTEDEASVPFLIDSDKEFLN